MRGSLSGITWPARLAGVQCGVKSRGSPKLDVLCRALEPGIRRLMAGSIRRLEGQALEAVVRYRLLESKLVSLQEAAPRDQGRGAWARKIPDSRRTHAGTGGPSNGRARWSDRTGAVAFLDRRGPAQPVRAGARPAPFVTARSPRSAGESVAYAASPMPAGVHRQPGRKRSRSEPSDADGGSPPPVRLR